MSKHQPEFALQCQIAEYLRIAYPRVMFLSDVRASLRLTVPQQVRQKKLQAAGFACPDMVIFAARHGYHGMFMELKASTPFLKDGLTLKTSEHLAEQLAAINALRSEGYRAEFVWAFEQARELIDSYLRGPSAAI